MCTHVAIGWLMADKVQQQTLSVRITDALRRRLERARQLTASKTGEPVSTSEIAKQFLESARDDRLEVIDLLAAPTENLLQIRHKGEAGTVLSRAEWTVLAHFVRHGVEAASAQTPNAVSRGSLVAILNAFLAVYALRTEGDSRLDAYYVGNLPAEDRPASAKRSGKAGQGDQDVVRRTVIETRRHADDVLATWQPLLAARNLYALLEEDQLAGAEDINRALRPFWSPLWRLAARGHYLQTLMPIRDHATEQEGRYQPPILPVSEGAFTLNFYRAGGQEFSLLLGFPPSRGVSYPISGFPRLNEFRTMLMALQAAQEPDPWVATHFQGSVSAAQGDRPATVSFRAHDNGITLSFSLDEWAKVQGLFKHAWEIPDIRQAWEAMTLEYGEL
jgi:hypothetical protein